MFLKPSYALSVLTVFCLTAQAQVQFNGQIGFDVWDIHTNIPNPNQERLLFLANSTPQWQYRNPSPWIRFEGQADLSPQLSAAIKLRGDQSSDWRVDELNVKWAVSPSLGAAVGVVDYKLSWCRIHEEDSPWVRENDPFCTVRTTDQAVGAAPGLQVYATNNTSDWSLQGMIGIYNPLIGDYDNKEFTNTVISGNSKVTKNDRVGINLSAVHQATGAEFRLGWQHVDQFARYVLWPAPSPLADYKKSGDIVFVGASFNPHPQWSVRATLLHSRIIGDWEGAFVTNGELYAGDQDIDRQSISLENIYRVNAKNTLALALSEYKFQSMSTFKRPNGTISYLPLGLLTNRLASISWRYEWQHGVYSALQASHSRSNIQLPSPIGTNRVEGTSFGARLGWRF